MDDNSKTKQQLIKELADVRQRLTQLETTEASLKQKNETLLESEEILRLLVDQMTDGVIIIDWNGTIRFANPTALKLVELDTIVNVIGRNIAEFIDPATLQGVMDAMALVQSDHKGVMVECKVITANGREKWVEAGGTKVHFKGSDCDMVNIRDITKRKQSEEKLRESEERFRVLTQSSSTAILLLQNNKWIYANAAATEMTGYTAQELLSMNYWDIVHPDDQQLVQERGQKRQKAEAVTNRYEFKIICKDGTVKWVDLSGTTIDFGGRPAGLISVLDITERKRMEAALHQSEERYRTILDEMEDGYQEADLAGNFTFLNEPFLRIFGYSRDEMMGTNFNLYGASEEIGKKVYHAFNQMYKTGIPLKSFECDIIRKDGARRTIEFYASLLRDSNDHPIGFRGIVRDITDRKQSEEEREKLQAQLTQAQKMESVGRLAGGIAHDFNNMLGVILGRAEMAMTRTDPAQPLYKDLQEIQKAADRSANLTRQLLAFARKQTVALKVLDLNKTVEGMLKMLRRLIGEDINLTWLPDKNMLPVKMDPSQIDQILANLCVNAKDAIDGVGKITIETGTAVFDEAFCANHMYFVPGDYVMIIVSDDGCGMDKETLDKLFEPFFTTKDVGQGTGLGLATVYGIVKQNGGFINVYSEPINGTTFRIYLPRHVGKTEQIQKKGRAVALPGSETVLLVEDEPAILEMTGMMLERLNYTVLAASTPGEAIRLAQKHTGEIHLLMTDVVMPEMNGRDLAKNILFLYPDIKRLFMSGYTANVIAHRGVLDEGVHFIQKPFSMKDLAAKLREVINSR